MGGVGVCVTKWCHVSWSLPPSSHHYLSLVLLLLLFVISRHMLALSVEKAPHYRAINWGEFRRKRFEGGL